MDKDYLSVKKRGTGSSPVSGIVSIMISSLVSPKRQVAKPKEGRNRPDRRQLQALPA